MSVQSSNKHVVIHISHMGAVATFKVLAGCEPQPYSLIKPLLCKCTVGKKWQNGANLNKSLL